MITKKRFLNIYPINRKAGEKIFTITFAALLEADFRAPSYDYETYFNYAVFLA